MKTIFHPAESRGFQDHGWLKSAHSFSFADYYDPQKMHFGALRVVNDDWIAGGKGFPTHPHENMEIVTIVLNGALKHQDTLGTSSVIHAGEVQRMSAGTGIAHSEFNASPTEDVNLFQIWVFPKEKNIKPGYEQKAFQSSDRQGRFQFVVRPDGEAGAVKINTDAYFSLGEFPAGSKVPYPIQKSGNGAYIISIEGELNVAGQEMKTRDAVGISETSTIEIKSKSPSKVLVIEVPLLR
jgi:quercetin 2,3-dioxygenase